VSISDYEVLFPAHVIATVVIHMMSHNMVEKIQSLMINTYKNIHQVVSVSFYVKIVFSFVKNKNKKTKNKTEG